MYPPHKTKIVATIGPASREPELLEKMIRAGMSVARLNFSHGDFASHDEVISNVRAAAGKAGRRVAIMADLPGPKIRIGKLAEDPVWLRARRRLTLTTDDIVGDRERISVTFPGLPRVVRAGNTLFLNDGLIELKVLSVEGNDVHCRVQVGGELLSRKGLNLPGIDLGISAFTEHDRACLAFALSRGVDAVSQSFVSSSADVEAVRHAAEELGGHPFIIAKVERAGALDNVEAILRAADGVMLARGDLGVEIPIEKMAVVQKRLMTRANMLGKPVITATQMLASMVRSRRPSRAEATDVANAILDGTDCVMLSEESAVGEHPVYAVAMLAKIARATEPHRQDYALKEAFKAYRKGDPMRIVDLIASAVERTVARAKPAALIVPTRSGTTARSIARFRLPVWVTAFSELDATCQSLQFSYGVHPVRVAEDRADWNEFARDWLHSRGVDRGFALLTQGPSKEHPSSNHRIEIIELGNPPTAI
jgi:pyruvate kinase